MLPIDFVERMQQLLSAEAPAFFESLSKPPRAGLRVNTLKTTPDAIRDLAPWRLEPLPWCASGFLVTDADARPGLHPLHRAGVYYLQEPSAMAVAEAVRPEAGDWVIDLAAAPGGKATHLVSLMKGSGLLVANDVTSSRLRALGENLERWGATNTLVTSERVGTLAARWGAVFDKVLLDAPCSGEGMFRKSEEALAMWSPETVAKCAARQDALLAEAALLVQPGGTLVYSTCTFAPEENEQVVAHFLREQQDFRLEPLTLPGTASGRPEWTASAPPSLSQTARLWPHKLTGEGHFIAKLRRDGHTVHSRTRALEPGAPKQARDVWEAFVNDTFAQNPLPDAPLKLQGDSLYALPGSLPELLGLKTLRAGVWLGTLKKKRFEPSHSLALALAPETLRRVETLELTPEQPELLRYLQGDVLESAGQSGWLIVSVLGFALGWGRRSQGVIKNAYPKGLRLRV